MAGYCVKIHSAVRWGKPLEELKSVTHEHREQVGNSDDMSGASNVVLINLLCLIIS